MDNSINSVLAAFSESESEEQRRLSEDAFEHASADGKGKMIEVQGTFRMRPVKVMFGKNDRVWPRFYIGDTPKAMGDLKLDVALAAVDTCTSDDGGTIVNKGDVTFITITIKKGPGADAKKIENTIAYAKPVLCMLAGTKDVKLTPEFLTSYFSVDISGKEVTRDHKMTTDVMVAMEPSIDKTSGKTYLNGRVIRIAGKDEKSKIVSSSVSVTDGAVAAAGKEVRDSQGNLKTSTMSMPADDDMPLPGGVTVEDC